MQALIKNREISNDSWTLLKDASNPDVLAVIPGKNLIVPLSFWKAYQTEVNDYAGGIAVWLDSHESVFDIGQALHDLALVALNFPVFSDGRAYSKARELREVLNYKGEVRAIGDVLIDQLYYMSRCGFDAFCVRFDQDSEESLAAFDHFKTGYQANVAEPDPLFRRR